MDITKTRDNPAERISKKTYFRELKHCRQNWWPCSAGWWKKA